MSNFRTTHFCLRIENNKKIKTGSTFIFFPDERNDYSFQRLEHDFAYAHSWGAIYKAKKVEEMKWEENLLESNPVLRLFHENQFSDWTVDCAILWIRFLKYFVSVHKKILNRKCKNTWQVYVWWRGTKYSQFPLKSHFIEESFLNLAQCGLRVWTVREEIFISFVRYYNFTNDSDKQIMHKLFSFSQSTIILCISTMRCENDRRRSVHFLIEFHLTIVYLIDANHANKRENFGICEAVLKF